MTSYTPTIDQLEVIRRLDRLLVRGPLPDPALGARIERLERAFQSYAASYPFPLWAPGLLVDNEMRGATEALLPISQLRAVFDLLLRLGCRFPPLLSGSYLHTAPGWLDFLQKLRPQLSSANPAATLREFARDGGKRTSFLFSLMLPHHFGGAFDRYPEQSRWLDCWLRVNHRRLGGRLRALDSACGSGEGTYGLAEQLQAAGYDGQGSAVHGSTIETVELFAAAHAFFPHDRQRQENYRARVAPLISGPDRVAMEFQLDDVMDGPGCDGKVERYDLVLCNGLLGGPLLHEPRDLAAALRALASRLAPGGVLLAADRFHAGWRLRTPAAAFRALMGEHGLTPLDVPEGVGGMKG